MGNITASITDNIARNLRQPESGFTGYFVTKLLKKVNHPVEVAAAQLSKIEPHHKVLEVGFGPGLGLRAAYNYIKDGSGHLYGIDISEAMLCEAEREMQTEIAQGRVSLKLGSVENLPYEDNMFDRIFHCNCYYFWDDFQKATGDLFRVLKPGGFMVTTLDPERVKAGEEKGMLKSGSGDPKPYMEALQGAGFSRVKIEPVPDSQNGIHVIYAYVDENK